MCSGNDPAHAGGCPIRTSLDHSLLAAPQGFSQRATSFIASWRQGIHRMPFLCSPQTFHAGSPRTAPKRAPGPHRTRSMGPRADDPKRSGQGQPLLYTHAHTAPASTSQAHTHMTLLTRTSPAASPTRMAVRPSRAARPTSAPTPIHTAKITPPSPTTPRPSAEGHKRRRDLRNPRRNAPCRSTSLPGDASKRYIPGDAIPGDDRDRTGDPLLAKQVLSQLSYVPFGEFSVSSS